MVDYYNVLGIGEDATDAEVKRAYQSKVFEHHPDRNPDSAKASQQQFQLVREAYEVLRDATRRSQYDRMRRAGFTASADFEAGAASPYGAGPAAPDFDQQFEEWFRRMGQEFQDYYSEQAEEERASAERLARAAAWEREKQEAQANKARAARLRQRTEDARHMRHAAILRRFWQTHSGLTAVDAGVIAAATLGAAGLAYAWKLHLSRGKSAGAEAQTVGTAQPAAVAAAAAAPS